MGRREDRAYGKVTIIRSEINTVVANGYTLDEFNANGYQNVKDDILKTLQDMFGGSDFIVGVTSQVADGIDPNIVLGGEKEWVKSYLKMR